MQKDLQFHDEFLLQLKEIIEANLTDSQFGVAELAEKVHMSRSNLLRKVKKLSDLSASQFINLVRLTAAMDLLIEKKLSVSEVGYEVGFGSTSYFIKCFREHYGYPPGEVGKKQEPEETEPAQKKGYLKYLVLAALLLLLSLAGLLLRNNYPEREEEKSIAVLPFINDSNDSTNVYFINGLMEAILNNLQKVGDLRVVSRSSVEAYRHSKKPVAEIARELGVQYFVVGSGQKVGDQILLNVQLIDAEKDQHLWGDQYQRQMQDVFELQHAIAQTIAAEIQVLIKPEEKQRMAHVPTQNLKAYDAYLKGLEHINSGSTEGLWSSIDWFKQALALDPEFAEAYAYTAIAYYYLDVLQAEKQFLNELNIYADKAMLYNANIPESLIAKGFYYMNARQYDEALPHFEKAHAYSPNSAWIVNLLSDFYTTYQPNSHKYLTYALKGERLNLATTDSTTAAILYLHLSNALIQNGFAEQALFYIDKALRYDLDNVSVNYVRAYVLFGVHHNMQETLQALLETLKIDSTRLDLLQEVGKMYYMLGDYENAYKHYKRFDDQRLAYQMDIFWFENGKISYVYQQVGDTVRARELYQIYKERAQQDGSIYKDVMLSAACLMEGDTDRAMDYLKAFAEQDDFHYWTLLFYKLDPLAKEIMQHPDFDKVWKKLEKKFWKKHRQIEAELKAEGLL